MKANVRRTSRCGFKSSPLFKHALNNAIDRLEGKTNDVSDGDKPTSKAGCSDPKAENTLRPICNTSEITCEGTHTCVGWGTCMGGNTCYSTCPETCSGNTCESTCESTCPSTCDNTCVGGTCSNYRFYGTNYWTRSDSTSNNWIDLPNNWSVRDCENYLKWYDESNIRFFGDWNLFSGAYDKTVTRTTTTSGYKLYAWAQISINEMQYFETNDNVTNSSTNSSNHHNLYLPLWYND